MSEPDGPGALTSERGRDANGQPRTGACQSAEKYAVATEFSTAQPVTTATSRGTDQKNIWLLTMTYQRSCKCTAETEPPKKADSLRSPRFPASTIDKASAKATQQIEAPVQTQCMTTEGKEYTLETPEQARRRVRERLDTKRELRQGRARARSLDIEEKTELHRIQIAASAPNPFGSSSKRKPAAQPSYARRGSLREPMSNPATVTPSGAPTPPRTAPNSPATDVATQLRDLEHRMRQLFEAQLNQQKASYEAYIQEQQQQHAEDQHRSREALRTALDRAEKAQDAVERSFQEAQAARAAATAAQQAAAAQAAQRTAAEAAYTQRPHIPTPTWNQWGAPAPQPSNPATPAPTTPSPIGPRAPDLKRFKVEKFTGTEAYPGLGCNFSKWHRSFVDAVNRDVAFYESTWSDLHLYHALKASLGQAVLLHVDTHEDSWRAMYPVYGYEQLRQHLARDYSTHLTHDAMIARLLEPKRKALTWQEHAQFMRHIQREVGASNQLMVDLFCKYASPEHAVTLIAHVCDKDKNHPATLDSAVNTLIALTGTGSGYTPSKKINHGRAMAAAVAAVVDAKEVVVAVAVAEVAETQAATNKVETSSAMLASDLDTGGNNAHCSTSSKSHAQPAAPAPATANQVANNASLEERINFAMLTIAEDADNNTGEANTAIPMRPSATWLLDSGCTHHLVNDPSVLHDPTPSNLRISVANKQQTTAQLKGKVLLRLHDTGHTMTLGEAHFVPNLSYNLISTSELDEKGATLAISNGKCDIRFGPHLITTSHKSGKLWPLQCTAQHVSAVTSVATATPASPTETPPATSMLVHEPQGTLQEWHTRLGHINKAAIIRMAEQADPKRMQVTRTARDLAEPCLDCAVGKQGRSKQPRIDTSASAPTDEIGAVISSDCAGKISPADRFGNRYFVNYVDHGSGYTAVFPIRKKSHQEKTAAMFIAMFEKQFNVKVKTFRYQTYLRNRVPSKANVGYKSPIEVLTGRQPAVDHVLAFGSVCTVHTPPKSKGIVRRAEVGRILGVNPTTKAYDIWVPRMSCVVTSKDVQNIGPPRSPNKVYAETLTDTFQRLTMKTPHESITKVLETHQAKTPGPRRSDRLTEHMTATGGEAQVVMATTIKEPRNPREALAGPQAKEWETAMQAEIDNLIQNGTWELVAKPVGVNIVGHKWVYKIKFDNVGEVERFKARLVAQGFSQRYGVDFTETFSPVIRQPSVRVLLVLAAILDVPVLHLDVPQAYVKAKLDTTVYMSVPALVPGDPNTQALLLKKSLYGLKQSGRMWHEDINATLLTLGYQKSQLDPCLYHKWTAGGITLIGLYVDDIIALTQDKTHLQSTTRALEDKYQVKTLGPVSRCLGINVHRSKSGMFLEQSNLVAELLVKHNMIDCHPQSTPIAVEHHMYDDGGPSDVTPSEMREIVGSLLWLASCTRPDIAFATNLMTRFLNTPNEHHGRQIRRVLRYLKATRSCGLELMPQRSTEIAVDIYTDADWAGDRATRRSTSGCIIKINGAPVHWFAKQQATVALSTMEAEYVAASIATQEAIWLRQLLKELRLVDADAPANLWCDNQSALKSMGNQTTTNRSKHIDIRYNYVREAIQNGNITTHYCKSDEMPADGLTKVLSAECLDRARSQLHVCAAEESKVMKELAAGVQL
ncbi:retrovirus-related Pol polyprotein from transposon TNT 1-94 [Achlya hypogyna]|uniref:Retrovirus-related Pol polyprotein from transposon TNT 1-94 n=1 Tax=Achlya hypogyna TaxID=1202772 RepID=A0A1V9YH81_ACHHY|nr:retrovirus-related Pol polyprotein from transposon TNT 1-94 [Achlya hypogyna]